MRYHAIGYYELTYCDNGCIMDQNKFLGLDSRQIWNTELAFQHLNKLGQAETKRTAERRLHEPKSGDQLGEYDVTH